MVIFEVGVKVLVDGSVACWRSPLDERRIKNKKKEGRKERKKGKGKGTGQSAGFHVHDME